jgi:hypothetical protein
MFTCARSGDAILKPDFSLKEPRPLPWRLCQSILDTCNQAWLLFYDYLERAAHLLMPLRVDQMMRQFGGISLGADISLWWIGGVSCTSLHCKTEDIITYLLLVGFWWFQHRRLFYCWFASVGTQEWLVGPPQEENGRMAAWKMHLHEYFRCRWCRWLSGRQWWMDGHERHVNWCFWVLGSGFKRFGDDWSGVGRAMRVIAPAEGCHHVWFDVHKRHCEMWDY